MRLFVFAFFMLGISTSSLGQKSPISTFHMTPYDFVYLQNPRTKDIASHINRERIRGNKIKTCTEITSRIKGKKTLYPPVVTAVYHYDTTGFPMIWDYYGEGFSASLLAKSPLSPYL